MAGNMHVPNTHRPSCWLDPVANPPETLPVRVDWCEDGAAFCANFATVQDSMRAMEHTPLCIVDGICARAMRARLIREGKVRPHERRKGCKTPPASTGNFTQGNQPESHAQQGVECGASTSSDSVSQVAHERRKGSAA